MALIALSNHLSATSFSLQFTDNDGNDIGCDVQSFTHPSVSVGAVGNYATPRRDIPVPGDKYEFDALSVSILLDEDLSIYKRIKGWIDDCITTDDEPQFRNKVTDVHLHVRSNKGNKTNTFIYKNAFPTNLGSVAFRANDLSDTFLTVEAEFSFSHFVIA